AQAERLEAARTAALRREQARLTWKHGEDSDAVREISLKLARHERTRGELHADEQAGRRQKPEPTDDAMAIYKQVADQNRRPVSGCVVRAVDARSHVLNETQSAKDGRYALEIPISVRVSRTELSPATEGAGGASTATMKVATERDSEPIYRD